MLGREIKNLKLIGKLPYDFSNQPEFLAPIHRPAISDRFKSVFHKKKWENAYLSIIKDYLCANNQNFRYTCEPRLLRKLSKTLDTMKRHNFFYKMQENTEARKVIKAELKSAIHHYGVFIERDLNLPLIDYETRTQPNFMMYSLKSGNSNLKFLEEDLIKRFKQLNISIESILINNEIKNLSQALEERSSQKVLQYLIEITCSTKLSLISKKDGKENIIIQNSPNLVEKHLLQFEKYMNFPMSNFILTDFDNFMETNPFFQKNFFLSEPKTTLIGIQLSYINLIKLFMPEIVYRFLGVHKQKIVND